MKKYVTNYTNIFFTEMKQVPAYFKQFLLIDTFRSEHMLEASNFIIEICLPSAAGEIYKYIIQTTLNRI